MSKELEDYLSKMDSAFKQAEQKIKSDYEKKPNKKGYALLLKHNDIILPFITQIYTGPGFKSEEDNDKAWDELFSRHVKFMKFYEDLMEG